MFKSVWDKMVSRCVYAITSVSGANGISSAVTRIAHL